MVIEVFAPAKVNLALHVTGRRDDGYHLLDSVVVFAGVGDWVRATPGAALSLTIEGPESAGLDAGPDNLVLRAARALGGGHGASIFLEKNLPVASGIGGGSADAAAALRALARLWGRPMPDAAAVLALGADVPVCLAGQPARMAGVGERLRPLPDLPAGLALLLVNPRVAVSTPAVFAALATPDNAPLGDTPERLDDADTLADWLNGQRNDLEGPARGIAPAIGEMLDEIGTTGSLVTRMSGSGATCFGLFRDMAAARGAEAFLSARRPGWWVRAAPLLTGTTY